MSEHLEQAALFQWAEIYKNRAPALEMLFAVPNGGKRHVKTAITLKAEGVKAGVPDVWLPVPSRIYHGMVIEMKFGKNTVTEEQKAWLLNLENHGWFTAVCYSWEAAAIEICLYLDLELSEFGLDFLSLSEGRS